MAETPKKQGRGCFFYGTITFVLVLIGVMLGVYFGARKAALAAIAKYTTNAPVAIPRLNLPPAEEERIARELAQTVQRVREGQGPSEIALGEHAFDQHGPHHAAPANQSNVHSLYFSRLRLFPRNLA